jgi:RNA recognition motif-containing protein
MAAEDQAPRTEPRPDKAKKRKKPKKDKWGQPLSAASPEVEPSVEPAQEPPAKGVAPAAAPEGYEPSKVVASGLPYTTTEADIRKLFEFYGPLGSVQLSRFPDSGNFRGLAFVCFEVHTHHTSFCSHYITSLLAVLLSLMPMW